MISVLNVNYTDSVKIVDKNNHVFTYKNYNNGSLNIEISISSTNSVILCNKQNNVPN